MILCCGEALVDFFETESSGIFQSRPGGSPLNTAVTLARLGNGVAFFGKISRDFLGDRIIKYMAENHVDLHLVTRSNSPTALAFVGTDPEKKVPRYAFWGKESSDREVEITDFPSQLGTEFSCVHFGSFSLIFEPYRSAFSHFARSLQRKVLFSFDPNVRPSLAHDKERYRQELGMWCRFSDIVKLSQEDLGWMFPNQPLDQSCQEILRRGVSLIALTKGAEGARLQNANCRVELPPPEAEVIDTVGTGDAFGGALLQWLESHHLLESRKALDSLKEEQCVECLTFANLVAARTAARRGADPPRKEDLLLH